MGCRKTRIRCPLMSVDYKRGVLVSGTFREEVIDSCAWILWAQAWISLQEEPETKDPVSPGAGGSWDPYVPDVPENVTEAARKIIASVEKLNGAAIGTLYARAIEGVDPDADAATIRRSPKQTPERFGTCIGYQAAGAGISVEDDFPNSPRVKVPYVEVNADSDTSAYVGGVDERFAK